MGMETLLDSLSGFLSHLGPLFILLGLLIFVHETGHFLVAKFFGVRVEVFSLGFGKKIFQFVKGDTNYCLSLIPLGGYIKMYGDDPSKEVPEEAKAYSFLHKSVGARMAIVLAGPLMNLLFAGVLFFIIAVLGEKVPGPQLGDLKESSVAYKAGFRSGDLIVKINDKQVSHWSQLKSFIEAHANFPLVFEVKSEADTNIRQVNATPELVRNENLFSTEDKVGKIKGFRDSSLAPIVAVVNADSPLAKAGFSKIEFISSINGQEISELRNLAPAIRKEFLKANTLSIKTTSEFGLKKEPSHRVVNLQRPKAFTEDKLPSLSDLDILEALGVSPTETYILKTAEDSPAAASGLQRADQIQSIGGVSVKKWEDIVERVKSYKKSQGALEFKILRGQEVIALDITPKMTELQNGNGQDDDRFTIGIFPAMIYAGPPLVTLKYPNLWATANRGIDQTWRLTKVISISLLRLVQGQLSHKNIGGIIMIGRVAGQTFKKGATYFLKMMAIISINLFLINLLPIPMLDGGHLVFFSIEALRGAPMSVQKMEVAQQVGLVLLIGLMIFTFYNDISNLINSPW